MVLVDAGDEYCEFNRATVVLKSASVMRSNVIVGEAWRAWPAQGGYGCAGISSQRSSDWKVKVAVPPGSPLSPAQQINFSESCLSRHSR